MPYAEKVMSYSVLIYQNEYLENFRQIELSLESGGTAQILFPPVRPENWLRFSGSLTILNMAANDYADVYRLLQSESPVFFSAIDIGVAVGSVHTELHLSAGETPGEGDEDPNSLVALIRRAKRLEQAGK